MTRSILGTLQMFAFAILAGIVFGELIPTLYALPLVVGVVVFNTYFTLIYIAYGRKQMFVELVYALWPVMPWKVRYWAIFSDDRN